MPLVTARMMPTIMPASMTSRKTMINAPSIGDPRFRSLHDEKTLGRVFVIIVIETIAAWRQGANLQRDLAPAGDDLLDPERLAFEFGGRSVEVGHLDGDRLSCPRRRLGRRKAMILQRDMDGRRLLGEGRGRQQAKRDQPGAGFS